MKLVNEWKNISDEVTKASEEILNVMLIHALKQPKKKSKINGQIFVTNDFKKEEQTNKTELKINLSHYFPNLQEIDVFYTMYFVDNINEYNSLIKIANIDMNCEADYEEKYIRIVSAFIGQEPPQDIYGDIMHEVNHLYEYDCGREKKVGLYELVKDVIQNQSDNTPLYTVALGLYYTFPHERDAFVHQFYGFLMQNLPEEDIDYLIRYSYYNQAEKVYNILKQNKNNKSYMQAINYFGYNRKDYFDRLKFSLKKFLNKIYNAFLRYRMETKPKNVSEGAIHRLIMLETQRYEDSQKYKEDIHWDIEKCYKFEEK